MEIREEQLKSQQNTRTSSVIAAEEEDTRAVSVDIGGSHATHVASMAICGPCARTTTPSSGGMVKVKRKVGQTKMKTTKELGTRQQEACRCQSGAMDVECGVM